MVGMPYVHDPSQVARALDLVLKGTTPGRVTTQHLEANGFPLPAAAQVWGFLRALGLLEAGGIPTDLWCSYRDAPDPEAVLRETVTTRYAALVELVEAGAVSDAELEAHVGEEQDEHAAHVTATFRALCERAGITIRRQAQVGRSRREVLHDVSDLLRRSVDEFEQARRCLANDLTRPAHVAAWNSFVALGFVHLAAEDFARLRTSGRRSTLPLDDLMRAVHGGELIRLLVKHELVDTDDKETLDGLLRLRNDSAHPMGYTPDREATAAYLSAVLSVSARLSERAAAATADAAPSTPPPPTTPR